MKIMIVYEQVDCLRKWYKTLKSYESMKKLKYLDAIIKESMRLNSPATINSRHCTEVGV